MSYLYVIPYAPFFIWKIMIVMGFRDIFYSFNQGQILIMPMKSKFRCHLLCALGFSLIQMTLAKSAI